MNRARIIFLFVFCLIYGYLKAQNSPFSTGKWGKIAVQKQGIYKLTGGQIRSLGFSLPILSSQLQLFNYDLAKLTEKVPAIPNTDLIENAIQVVDGGDGKIDENDYILFYSDGNVLWQYDAESKRVKHIKKEGGDSVYYYVTLGLNGKRIIVENNSLKATDIITKFTQHILFEKDSISLLNSGKLFWGPPMGVGVGKQSQLVFNVNTLGMSNADLINAYVQLASTSYSSNGIFNFSWNDQVVHSSIMPMVSGLLFDDIASVVSDSFASTPLSNWPNYSQLKVNYTSANSSATGWLDFIELHVNKPVSFGTDSILSFHVENKLQTGLVYNCVLQNTDTTIIIWNVTKPNAITQLGVHVENGLSSFMPVINDTAHFYAVRQNAFETPTLIGLQPNSNTFKLESAPNYIIITAPAYLNTSYKYQAFQKTNFNRNTLVVNARDIYNDFAGGQASPIAIRNYLKYILNNAKLNNQLPPEYLLLLGMGNFNPRKINLDFELPVFESENSNSVLMSYATDDFFAVLNDNDNFANTNDIKQLSLAVGRIPARTIAEADSAISKLIYYQSNTEGGNWENKLTWVADDGDYNLHLQDAESIVQHLQANAPNWNHHKIYLDLFPAVNSSAGNTYPLAFNAIQQAVQDGTIMINYTGHGNYLRLSEEAVISQAQFDNWANKTKLPLMVTASCNFAPYDQPTLNPIAFDALMKNSKGIIGLVAANRLVFAYSNKQINDLFIQQLLVPDTAGQYLGIGQALQKAKMNNWLQGGDHINAFKFGLLGDPAMRLLSPNYAIAIEQINGRSFKLNDTLLSGSKYNFKGTIKLKGSAVKDFNGQVELIIYDAVKYKKTLANQTTSMSVPIAMQENILFKGKASVEHGNFSIDFLLPAQVSNVNSPIRLSLAATSGFKTAMQTVDSLYVRANNIINQNDTIGPKLKAYLNDPLFKSGGWAPANSTLYISLEDSSGIQTSGNSLGHDLNIWLDDNPVPLVLNNYFNADLNTFSTGKVIYALPTLSAGKHKCIIEAWDLLSNGSKDSLFFEVPASNNARIKNVMNFPNPVVNQTRFSFETNMVGKEIQVRLEIMDLNGEVKFQKNETVVLNNTRGYIDWDGLTNDGNLLPKTIFFYRISIQNNQQTASMSNSFIKL